MGEHNVEKLEYLRYIISKEITKTSSLKVNSDKESKEKQHRLEILESINFLILDKLRKILH